MQAFLLQEFTTGMPDVLNVLFIRFYAYCMCSILKSQTHGCDSIIKQEATSSGTILMRISNVGMFLRLTVYKNKIHPHQPPVSSLFSFVYGLLRNILYN